MEETKTVSSGQLPIASDRVDGSCTITAPSLSRLLQLSSTSSLPNPRNCNYSINNDLSINELITARRIHHLTNAATRTRPAHHKELGLTGDDSILGDLTAIDLHDGVGDSRRLEMSFDFLDAAALVFSMGSYLFDIVTDITVAIFHYLNHDYLYCYLTVAFIILPSLITTIISMRWYIIDSKIEGAKPVSSKKWLIRILFHILQIGPVYRYYQSLQYGLRFREARRVEEKKKMYMKMIYEDADSAMLRVFDAFIEAAPQLLLQIKILNNRFLIEEGLPFADDDFWTTTAQCVSITTSLTSIAWALVIYRKSLRKSLPDKIPLQNFMPLAFMFTFEFFSICARVIALSLLISSPLEYYQIISAILAHWFVMTLWVISMKTNFCETKLEERGWAVLLGFILVFCFLNAVDKQTRRKYFAFYSIMILESIPIMYLSVACYQTNRTFTATQRDLRLGITMLHYIFLALAIFFMLVYYRFFHPTRKIKVFQLDCTR